jgi:two-component system, cell cycle sensor histidine kinase and response regulator CckA
MSDTSGSVVIDRSDRPGRVGILLLFAGLLVGAAVALSFIASDQAQPFIVGLLALLAVAGVFSLFAFSIGLVQFSGPSARNDLTKLVCDTAGEGLIAVDDAGRLIYANEGYLMLTSAASLADLQPVDRLFSGSPDVADAIYRLAQAVRDDRSLMEEIRLTPALGGNGPVGWYRVEARPLNRTSGRAVVWKVADITHERERQENVFLELQHAIDYLDHAPSGFLSVNALGEIVYMNATLAGWLGYDLAKVGSGGLKVSDIAAEAATAIISSVSGAPNEVRTETLDLDLSRRNGQTLPVRLYHRVAFGADGTPGPSRTLVMNRSPGEDVAEGQRAAEVRFARFFNNTPLAIATVDRAGKVLRTNASFSRLFGVLLGPDKGAGSRSILSIIASNEHSGLQKALAEAHKGKGEIAPIDLSVAGDGERSARFFVSSVEDKDGDGEVAILYALETTEQRALEQQFAQAQKMQAVGQLAGGVAHDFNNVLQAIIGYSDLLLTQHRPTDPSFQDIMQIKQNANRAASLVRQLLAFSRRQTLRPQVVELGDVLSDLSLLLKRLLGEKVELDLHHGRDLWPIKADVNQFEQVIVNLAVNARDAMPKGGKVSMRTANVTEAESARYNYRGLPNADYVLIEVEDTGTGIPLDVRDKIFEPFFTTKEVGKGTGLGLSTVYGIVKQTGGFIYLETEIDKGTEFRIFLPRHIPDPATIEAPKVEVAPSPTADLTGRGAILYVEDEEAVRAFGARALSARGYTVLQAASGVEALALLDERDDPIDLIVSDVVMPEMDGPTLLGELRKRGVTAKVIFCSGYAEEAFAKNLPEGEAFGFLPKPFSLKQLIEAVKEATTG